MNNIFTAPDESVFQGKSNDNVELAKAWAGTTVAYALYSIGGNLQGILTPFFLQVLLTSAIVCGLGFVIHELAHRVVARGYGAEAHFVSNDRMLLLSMVIALAGLFLAAPGAVWYRGYLSKAQNGKIALAGPISNYVLSILFFLVLSVFFVFQIDAPAWLQNLCYSGFVLNGWLGLFNMIPAGPFDGAKVLAWNTVVFGVTVAIGALLVFVLQRQEVQTFLFDLVLRVM